MKLARLGDVCEIIMGQAPPGETYNLDGQGLPLIAGASDFGKVSPDPSRFTTAASKTSKVGDIVLCIRATIGNLNWSDKEYCLGGGVAGVRAKTHLAVPSYIWWALDFSNESLNMLGKGATFLQISRADIETLEIPLPPLDEQRRIAAILDQADTLRGKRREAMLQLSQLGHAIFNQMFPFGSMKRKPLLEMIEIQSGLVDPKKDEYADLPHIGPEHIQKGTGELLPFRTAREDAVTSGKFLFDETCVLYSKIRPNLNKVALAVGRGLCSADMYAVRPKEMQSTREYIWFLLRTADFLVHASGFSNRANIPKLNKEQVLSYLAPAPTFDEMLEFSKRIDTLQKLRSLGQDHLNQLEGSFASLQHRAFRGEL